MKEVIVSVLLFVFTGLFLDCQEGSANTYSSDSGSKFSIGGFIRGGFYSWTDKTDDRLYVSTAFSDISLKLDAHNISNLRAYADIRFRYGSEFLNPVSKFDIREAWAGIINNKWDLSIGQKIIKWGRCDFTNPISSLSPLNTVLRSPDREDMNMANLLADLNLYPSEKINLEAVIMPFYRSSVLIIDPVPLPDFVTIKELPALVTDKEMFSYGLKSDFHFRMIDWSISWFEGYNPMPGIALTEFNIDLEQSIPVPSMELSVKPYKTRIAGIDFETIIGSVGLRGEASWSDPLLSHSKYEYVPMPEIEWIAGADWSTGQFIFTAEYSGKYIIDFAPSDVAPLIGTEPDLAELVELMSTPGFDYEYYVTQQVSAFNRLYNNQLKKQYHFLGLRIEAEILYGKLLPSLFTMYNFTSRDMLLIPELEIKPADAIAVRIGAEIYSGPKGSMYDLINDFMNSVYVSLRFDF
jgi:hypothetical protein